MLRGTNKAISKIKALDFRVADFLRNPIGYGSREKRVPGELPGFQRPPFPS